MKRGRFLKTLIGGLTGLVVLPKIEIRQGDKTAKEFFETKPETTKTFKSPEIIGSCTGYTGGGFDFGLNDYLDAEMKYIEKTKNRF